MKFYRELQLRRGFQLQMKLYHLELAHAKGGAAAVQAREELEKEWGSVIDMMTWCTERSSSDKAAGMLLSKLAGMAGHLTYGFLSISEQLLWRDAAYEAARRTDLVNDELGHGAQLAYLHFATGNVERAHELVDQLLVRNEEALDSPGDAGITQTGSTERSEKERGSVRATLLSHQASFLAAHNQYEPALPKLEEAMEIHRQGGMKQRS